MTIFWQYEYFILCIFQERMLIQSLTLHLLYHTHGMPHYATHIHSVKLYIYRHVYNSKLLRNSSHIPSMSSLYHLSLFCFYSFSLICFKEKVKLLWSLDRRHCHRRCRRRRNGCSPLLKKYLRYQHQTWTTCLSWQVAGQGA